jgi:membrane-bound serine protease (ClpP class)
MNIKKILLIGLLFMLSVVTVRADTTSIDSVKSDTSNNLAVESNGSSLVLIMTVDGAIGTVTADRIIDVIAQAEEEHADLLIIKMNTPGGFVAAVWPITKAIMNSSVPVAIYIAPSGSKAASAGVYITYSAQIAAMAPGCNIGAAHVVGEGGAQLDSVMNEKVMNDAVASLKAMSERNGRNGEWAEEAARHSVSITSTEALKENVINYIADNVDDLLRQIDGTTVNMALGKKTIHLKNPVKEDIKETFIQSILDIISSPNIVFILFSLGGLGLVLELYNPGAILPGVVGGICIILAFYGMRTLPINYAGVLLLIFAITLFILEIKIVSHGLLTIGGVISIIIGGMMLINTSDPDLRISRVIIVAVALVIGGFVLLAFTLAYKARVAKPTTGKEGLIGETGVVKSKIDVNGYVAVAGELWEAVADEVIEEGEQIEVMEVKNLKLKVRKKSKTMEA